MGAPKMTAGVRIRPGRGGARTRAGIWDVIQWAVQRERASIDFEDDLGGGPCAVGMEYRLMEIAALGCAVDGGGTSPCHPDADLVAAALAVLPDAFGGRRMALWIVELARSGQVPDWMAGARPRVEPVEWAMNQFQRYGKTEVCDRIERVVRGRRRVQEVRWCPVRYRVTPGEIAGARRAYREWWLALLALQLNLREGFGLSGFEITPDMPPVEPWQEGA